MVMSKIAAKEGRFRLGITHGDVNGIGYEVILKALSDNRMVEMLTPVVYGSGKVASYYRKTVNIPDFQFNIISKIQEASPRKPNLLNITDQEIKIELGQPTTIGGEMALLSMEKVIADFDAGELDAIVTAPIHKKSIQSESFRFPGHTEYFANHFNIKDYLMLMVFQGLRIGMVTGHIPLQKVAASITEELILRKLAILQKSLIQDFAVRKPKIAVLGLNPHAGDEGLLGDEENQVIIPAIAKANEMGILAFGPYPADGFFGSVSFRHFDGVLAMYHDQGLAPFKTMAFHEGVNFTAGLPLIRTSPVHGTGFTMAGKDQASADSFRQAMLLALDIHRNRLMYQELTEDPVPAGTE